MTVCDAMDLSRWLREQIIKKNFQDEAEIPSAQMLAKRFDLRVEQAQAAVAQLVTENILFEEAGKIRVRSMEKRIEAAKGSGSKKIGVLMNTIDSYVFSSIVSGINRELEKEGYTAVMQFTNNRISAERGALETFLNGDFEGLIIEPTKAALPQLNYDLYQRIALAKPAVLLHARIPMLPIPAVTSSDKAGAMELTEFLFSKGHTNITFIGRQDEQTGVYRYLGFAAAYAKAGRPVPDDNIFWFERDDYSDVFQSTLHPKLRIAFENSTAVICHDDRLALRLKQYNTFHPVLPPGAVICGFDNSDIAAVNGFPSMAHPKERMGAQAVQSLWQKMEDFASDPSLHFRPQLFTNGYGEDAATSFGTPPD